MEMLVKRTFRMSAIGMVKLTILHENCKEIVLKGKRSGLEITAYVSKMFSVAWLS